MLIFQENKLCCRDVGIFLWYLLNLYSDTSKSFFNRYLFNACIIFYGQPTFIFLQSTESFFELQLTFNIKFTFSIMPIKRHCQAELLIEMTINYNNHSWLSLETWYLTVPLGRTLLATVLVEALCIVFLWLHGCPGFTTTGSQSKSTSCFWEALVPTVSSLPLWSGVTLPRGS